MNARKSGQPSKKATTPSLEATTVEKLPDLLTPIFDDFINAHAFITVAYRLIEEFDDHDREAAVLVLGKGVEALNAISDKLESAIRLRKEGGAS
jgi:hypothetical protein